MYRDVTHNANYLLIRLYYSDQFVFDIYIFYLSDRLQHAVRFKSNNLLPTRNKKPCPLFWNNSAMSELCLNDVCAVGN